MTEFKLGFNIQTVLIVICIISSICLLIFGGYLIAKSFCNKNSEETTKWTPDSYDKLKNK